MKHKTFETWILSERDLNPEERKALYDHLIECSECDRLDKRLRMVEHLLGNAPEFAPAPGFSRRFLVRLDQQENRVHSRQRLFVLLGAGMAAALLLWVSGLHMVFSLDRLIVDSLHNLADVGGPAGPLGAVFSLSLGALANIPPLLPAALIMAGFAAAGAAAILWMKLLRMLSRPTRKTQQV